MLLGISYLGLLGTACLASGSHPWRCVDRRRCGTPLHLTPYLVKGQQEMARRLAWVPPLLPGTTSYSGFFTVNDEHGINIFFWLFLADKEPLRAPVVVSLPDGPAGSGTAYAFRQGLGPFAVDRGMSLKHRLHYFGQNTNVVYLDIPAGVGFSYANETGYSRTEEQIGLDAYRAVYQFFELFPEFYSSDLYIHGMSYAGKFVTALAYTIHMKNPTSSNVINLKGVAIGNGFINPKSQLGWSRFLYSLGVIDAEIKKLMSRLESDVRALIHKKQYLRAEELLSKLMNIGPGPPSLYVNMTGLSYNNFLQASEFRDESHFPIGEYLNQPEIRAKTHAGDREYYLYNARVLEYLKEDFTQTVAPWLEVILSHYRVLLYFGQLDVICAYDVAREYIDELKWNRHAEFKAAKRVQWHVKGELAGYAKSGGNLTEVFIRNAGHCAPCDQPGWVVDLLERFYKSSPFD